jgi:hypothetical protein
VDVLIKGVEEEEDIEPPDDDDEEESAEAYDPVDFKW